jgi:hypothetical protein
MTPRTHQQEWLARADGMSECANAAMAAAESNKDTIKEAAIQCCVQESQAKEHDTIEGNRETQSPYPPRPKELNRHSVRKCLWISEAIIPSGCGSQPERWQPQIAQPAFAEFVRNRKSPQINRACRVLGPPNTVARPRIVARRSCHSNARHSGNPYENLAHPSPNAPEFPLSSSALHPAIDDCPSDPAPATHRK